MVFLSDYTLEKAELKPKILKLFCILRLHIFLQFAFQGQTFKFKSYLFHALASPTYCKELALHGFNPFNWTLPLPFLPFLCCFLQAVLPISFCDYYLFFYLHLSLLLLLDIRPPHGDSRFWSTRWGCGGSGETTQRLSTLRATIEDLTHQTKPLL